MWMYVVEGHNSTSAFAGPEFHMYLPIKVAKASHTFSLAVNLYSPEVEPSCWWWQPFLKYQVYKSNMADV